MAGWPGIRKVLRVSARGLTIVVALLCAAVVSSLTVDLGPSTRAAAERAASRQLKRPVAKNRHDQSTAAMNDDLAIVQDVAIADRVDANVKNPAFVR